MQQAAQAEESAPYISECSVSQASRASLNQQLNHTEPCCSLRWPFGAYLIVPAAELKARLGGTWRFAETFDCFEDQDGVVFEGIVMSDSLSSNLVRVWIEHRTHQVALATVTEGRLQLRRKTLQCPVGDVRGPESMLERLQAAAKRGRALQLASSGQGETSDSESNSSTDSESERDSKLAGEAEASADAGGAAPIPGEGAAAGTGAALEDATAPMESRAQKAAPARSACRGIAEEIDSEFRALQGYVLEGSPARDLCGIICNSAGARDQQRERRWNTVVHV